VTAFAPQVTLVPDPDAATAPGSVARLDGEPLPAAVLADIARGIAAARPLWGAVVRHDLDERRPVRLLATDRYEVWVIGWTPGQGVELHDHGGSAGTFVVTAGELTELLPARDGLVARNRRAGDLRHVPVGAVHDVVNRGIDAATSIHVYSPPLTSMNYYDDVTRERVATVAVDEDEPLLQARAASFLRHPANRG
jgi:predicted metal-dependent enzyme (double-stranded beta helix superfamily)